MIIIIMMLMMFTTARNYMKLYAKSMDQTINIGIRKVHTQSTNLKSQSKQTGGKYRTNRSKTTPKIDDDAM